MVRFLAALVVLLTSNLAWSAPVRVVILSFEGPSSGGAELADAVELELELAEGVVLVPRRPVEKRLRRGRDRLSADSVSSALRSSEADLALTGQGRDSRDGPVIDIRAYTRDGQMVVNEVFTLTSDEPDADTLAPLIADSLREAVASGLREVRPRAEPEEEPAVARSTARSDDDLFVDDAELEGRRPVTEAPPRDSSRDSSRDGDRGGRRLDDDAGTDRGGRPVITEQPEPERSRSGWGDHYRDEDQGDDRAGRDNPGRDRDRSSRRDDPGDQDRRRDERDDRDRGRRRLLDEGEEDWDRRVIAPVRREEPRPRVGDIDAGTDSGERTGARALLPYVAVAAAFEPLYWNYAVEAAAGRSRVDWSPLSPLAGGSLRLEVWPIPYAGVDAQARFGKVQVDLTGIPGLNEKAIEIYFYEAQLHLRGQYLLDATWPGFAVGARLGYRFLMADTAPQTPFTVVPGYTAHMLAPGVDIRLPFHPQYAVLMASAEVVPFALYTEAPDEPGQPGSASLFGWRVDALFRSTIAYGIFVELRLFYEEFYVTYAGAGTRTDAGGGAFADGKVTTGLRGLSLGAGWSY
ncbi:MAG: hypothetical protein ABIJ09_16550 [Pseudomonadota bacterium]